MTAAHSVQFLTPETIGEMGTSFRRNHFWDRLGGQAIVMIGWWYSRQPLTNHKDCLSTKRSQKSPVGTPPHEQQRQMSAVFSGSQAATVLPNGSEKRWRQRWKKARPKKTWALILSVVDIIIVIFIIMLEYNRRNLLKKKITWKGHQRISPPMFEHRMAWHSDLGVAWQSDCSVESSSSSKLYFNSDWRVAHKRLYLREINTNIKYIYLTFWKPGCLKSLVKSSTLQAIFQNLICLKPWCF